MERLHAAITGIGSDWANDATIKDFRPAPFRVLGSGKVLQINSPIVVRSDGLERANRYQQLDAQTWNRIGSIVRRLGGMLWGPIEIFQSMPIKDIPIRMCPISTKSMPLVDELTSSDMIELQLYPSEVIRENNVQSLHPADKEAGYGASGSANRIGDLESILLEWPIDTADAKQLSKKMELLRQTCEGRSPVGVAVCLISDEERWLESLISSLQGAIDFITVRMPQVCLPVGSDCPVYLPSNPVEATKVVREVLKRNGMSDLPLVIDAVWENGYHAAQVLLAGANAVVVDSFLISQKPSESSSRSGNAYESLNMSGLLPPSDYSSIVSRSKATAALEAWDIEGVLTRFVQQLHSARVFCQR